MPRLPRVALPWRRKEKNPEKLYGAIVAQARLPIFYQEFGVPDTLEGRFVLLSLHLFAVLHRLKTEGTVAHDLGAGNLAQELVDRFSEDMETVLRELGVSDLRIPKKVRGLARSSTALLHAYEEAFGGSEQQLIEAVGKALPLEGERAEAVAAPLAHYLSDCVRVLEQEPYAALDAGTLRFPQLSARG